MGRQKIERGFKFKSEIPQFLYDTQDAGRGVSLYSVLTTHQTDLINNVTSRWIGCGEQQKVTFSAVPDAGYWRIEYKDVISSDLAYNASNNDIQTELELLVGAGNVVVSGDYSTGIIFDFVGDLLGRDLFTLIFHHGVAGNLTSSSIQVNMSVALLKEANEEGIVLADTSSLTINHDFNSDVTVNCYDISGDEIQVLTISEINKNSFSITNDSGVSQTFTILLRAGVSGSSDTAKTTVNQVSHGFDEDFIYHNGTTWVKAQANSENTLATHFARRVSDDIFEAYLIGTLNVSFLDDASGALTAGDYYYLSQSLAGKVTKTKYGTGILQPLFKMNQSTEMILMIDNAYEIDFSTTILSSVNTWTAENSFDLFKLNNSGFKATLSPTTLTANRTYTFPNASGTIPLLESANTFTNEQTFTTIKLSNDVIQSSTSSGRIVLGGGGLGFGARIDLNGASYTSNPSKIVLYNTTVTNNTDFLFEGASSAQRVVLTGGPYSGTGPRIDLRGTTYPSLPASMYLDITAPGNLICTRVYNVVVSSSPRALNVDSGGVIGYVSSVRATKNNISYEPDTSFIYDLKPVSFEYRLRNEAGEWLEETDGIERIGLIAEDVDLIKPEMTYKSAEGELEGVDYQYLIPALLDQVQKLRKEINELKGVV